MSTEGSTYGHSYGPPAGLSGDDALKLMRFNDADSDNFLSTNELFAKNIVMKDVLAVRRSEHVKLEFVFRFEYSGSAK